MNAPAHNEEHQEGSHFHTFIWIAFLLALLTFFEIVIIYVDTAPTWAIVWGLVGLSVIKFLAVIFWFMHLLYDQKLNTVFFLLGLAIASGTVLILMLLFLFDPVPSEFPPETSLLPPSLAARAGA